MLPAHLARGRINRTQRAELLRAVFKVLRATARNAVAQRNRRRFGRYPLLALDADTGVLKWHYQFTPHDIHDWDSTQVPVLGDVTFAGQPHKVVMLANRNGFFYVLDRESGKLLLGKPFTGTNWAREIGPDGRPVVLEDVGTREKD